MRISIVATKITLDTGRITNAILSSVRDQMIDAAGEFMIAAASEVPIDTGMARGSFLNLLSLLELHGRGDIVNKIADGIPREPRKIKKYWHYGGGIYPKTPQTATLFSTKLGQIIKKSGTEIKFNYKTDVRHYEVNEGKWESFARGQEAFDRRMRAIKPMNIDSFVIKTKYTTRDGGGYTSESKVQ